MPDCLRSVRTVEQDLTLISFLQSVAVRQITVLSINYVSIEVSFDDVETNYILVM